ncbi:MAG: hypothetical protein LAT64_02070 [Phycisphaerales bacterium]|nr:hypothetical protein [Planctomycetota bacterium]MCH8507544.1 hypothetical protein [Phycisphaerales bacterium]
MKIRRTVHPGFALVHSLAAACLTLWAAAALWPAPDEPPPTADAADARDAPFTEVVVTLVGGRELRGRLIERNDEAVVIQINGIDTTLPRHRVASVRVLPPVEERYRTLRAAVEDSDVRARLALVEWLRGREAYQLALEELEGILEVDPGNPDATTLKNWLENHLRLAARSRTQRRERREPPAPAINTLTEQEINRIRVYEIDLSTPTRIIIPDAVMRELMVRYPETFPVEHDEREAILKREPMDKLRMIFERTARDLYDRVRVLEDPPAMATFKSRIHGSGGWIVNACASNRCHGGTEAGRLQLLNQRINSDKTVYTNFLILERFRLADGTPLINHDEPARSPLLHMAMNRQASLYPHPKVDVRAVGRDWRPVFRSTEDRRFRETVAWINSLYNPRPDYQIEYPRPSSDNEQEQHGPQTDPDNATDNDDSPDDQHDDGVGVNTQNDRPGP